MIAHPTPEYLGRLINSDAVEAWFKARGTEMWTSQRQMMSVLQAANWLQYERNLARSCQPILLNPGLRSGKTTLARAIADTHEHTAIILHSVDDIRRLLGGGLNISDRVFLERDFDTHQHRFKLAIYDKEVLWRGAPQAILDEHLDTDPAHSFKGRLNSGDLTVWLI